MTRRRKLLILAGAIVLVALGMVSRPLGGTSWVKIYWVGWRNAHVVLREQPVQFNYPSKAHYFRQLGPVLILRGPVETPPLP